MQTQPLQFARPTQVAAQDFFSGGNTITPTPEILAIGDKYKPVEGAKEEPPTEAPAVLDLNQAALQITPELDSLLDKYKADIEPPVVETPAVPPVVTEPVAATPPTPTSTVESTASEQPDDVGAIANLLQEKGLIVEIPEGFPTDQVTKDNLWELIELNFNKKVEAEFSIGYEAAQADISRRVTDETLEILNYQIANPNASKEEVRYHIDRILYARDVADLDPSDPTDAEIIIRQYLSAEFSPEEVQIQLDDAIKLERLEQQATMWKPKVVQRAQAAVQQDRQRQAQIIHQDQLRHQEFIGKVDTALKANTLMGIPLGQEERARVRAILSQDNIPVPVKGGQTVEMGLMEYLVSKNKYAQDGNVENLIMSALILDQGPKAFDKYIVAPVKKESAVKFEKQKATGSFSAAPAPQRNTTGVDQSRKKDLFWSRYGKKADA